MASRQWLQGLVCAALLLATSWAQAHKASDAYLQIDAAAQGTTVRLDVALRDLEAALDLDTDQDGKLTWGEVKAGHRAVRAGAFDHSRLPLARW